MVVLSMFASDKVDVIVFTGCCHGGCCLAPMYIRHSYINDRRA